MTNATKHSVAKLGVAVTFVALLAGLGAASVVAGSARVAAQPQTLVSSRHGVWAFAQDGGRIAWIGRLTGRGFACALHVRGLHGGPAAVTVIPAGECHDATRTLDAGAVAALALAGRAAAWIYRTRCSAEYCWRVATLKAGARRPRVVDRYDVPSADLVYPLLAGAGRLLAYNRAHGNGFVGVERVVGGRPHPLFAAGSDATHSGVEGMAVGGGLIATVGWRVVSAGDGCGCLYAPAWSPDGSKIAFVQVRLSCCGAIAVMNADGSGQHDITASSPTIGQPTWSPNGQQIAYFDDGALMVTNADGSGLHSVTAPYSYVNSNGLTWSPDGTELTFDDGSCGDGNGSGAILAVHPDGTGLHQLATFACNEAVTGLAWSPNGAQLAVTIAGPSDGPLEVMNADGSDLHQLGTATGEAPTWSPDGSQIAFQRCGGVSFYESASGVRLPLEPPSACLSPTSGLWVVGTDGRGLRQLTSGPDLHPSWSAEGNTITFSSSRNLPDLQGGPGVPGEVFEIAANGRNLRALSFRKPADVVSEVRIHTARGRLLSSFEVHGFPYPCGVAVTSTLTAICAADPEAESKITLFNTRTGTRLVAVRVPLGSSVVGADGHWVVFHTGTAISAINVRSHSLVRLATAAADPLDLSVSGRRVAWAENGNGRGSIRALELPS